MKKNLTIIFLTIFSISYANAPDLSKAWTAINHENYSDAQELILKSFDSIPKEWKCCFCEESHRFVEDLMHLYLSQFYIAYLMKDQKSMENISEGMKNLIFLEYRLNSL